MAKRSPLVSQHLENISREALEKYQEIVRRYVRRRQGVYALYRRNKLYYIGLASNLRSRLVHHLRDHHQENNRVKSLSLTLQSGCPPQKNWPFQIRNAEFGFNEETIEWGSCGVTSSDVTKFVF